MLDILIRGNSKEKLDPSFCVFFSASLSSPSSPLPFSGHPTYTHASTASVYYFRLRLYRDFDDPVTIRVCVCVLACSFSPMLKILGEEDTNGNSYFLWRKSDDRRSRCSLSVSMHRSRSPRFFDLVRERASADIRRTISLGMEMDRRLRARARARWRKRIVGWD